MTAWTSDELTKIGTVEELEIAPLRRDGRLRRPVPVWVVRLGDDLYVRSVNGRSASWFRAAQACHEGRIRVAGVEQDVTFVEIDDRNDEIDDAYRAKYGRYPSIVPHIVNAQARAATLKLVPRSTSS
jgi:hypothetical protein